MERLHRRVAVLVFLAIVAGACGDDSADTTTSTQPAATTTVTAGITTSSNPTGVSAAPAHAYECLELMSEAEMQAAVGPTAAFFSQDVWTDTPGAPEGQTYCQYFAENAGISIAFAVFTGPSFDVYLGMAGTPGGEPLGGIGDSAVIAPDGTAGAAQINGTGVTVAFIDLGAGFGELDVRAAVIAILELVVSRV